MCKRCCDFFSDGRLIGHVASGDGEEGQERELRKRKKREGVNEGVGGEGEGA